MHVAAGRTGEQGMQHLTSAVQVAGLLELACSSADNSRCAQLPAAANCDDSASTPHARISAAWLIDLFTPTMTCVPLLAASYM
jgi:hypothetical protein